MTLVNQMIRTRRLTEFVNELVKIRNEETEDQTVWEFWLHKVFDMGFSEYLEKVKAQKEPMRETSEDDLKETVITSVDMLNGFCLP